MSEQRETDSPTAAADDPHAIISALKVQRDSAHRQRIRVETHNRVIRRHQEEVRVWLAEAIAQWEDVIDAEPAHRDAAAHAIHQRAIELLAEAESYLQQ